MNNIQEDYRDKERSDLIQEKSSLEMTLKSLSEEVETLSTKNEEFLSQLRKRDFFQEYQNASNELNSLRDAHMMLINMIESNDLNISSDTSNVRFY